MRITILQGPFLPVPPLLGGAVEKMWFELGKQFSTYGHSVVHISRAFEELDQEEYINGVRHIRIKGFNAIPWQFIRNILDLLYTLRALSVLPVADVIVTNTFWSPLIIPLLSKRFGRVVVDVQRMPKGQIALYFGASCLRANSTAVAQAIRTEVPYLANRIATIPNPLPFLPPPPVQRERLPVLLYAGRLHPEKGISLLLDAFAIAYSHAMSGWSLRLVGPDDVSAGGGGQPWLRRLLSQPHLTGLPIECLGPLFVKEDLLTQYYEAALFVYPSLAERGETFGLAPLEAMACGSVPIVSSLACFLDFITPGVNGSVFDHLSADPAPALAKEMIALATQPNLRMSMASAALEVGVTHHPTRIAAEFLDCFRKLCS